MRLFLLIGMCMIFVMLSSIAVAGNLSFAVNQTDYYFVVGEQAIIPIEVNNTYGKSIDGLLTNIITQETNQGGFHYSSTNSNSQAYLINEGEYIERMGVGTADTSTLLKIRLSFEYEESIVELEEIQIHFVINESQKQDQQNRMESQSEKKQEPQQQPPSQQQSQTQKKANSMQQNMNQDMNSLKQQMEESLKQTQQMEQEFAENIENNEQFKEMQKQLEEQGYNLSDKQVQSEGNNSGDFQYNYEKEGKSAQIRGSMDDGKMENLISESAEDLDELRRALEGDDKFKQFKKELEEKGFSMEEPNITKITSKEAKANVPFRNSQTNQTANITAEFINKTPKNIRMHEQKDRGQSILLFLIVLVIVIIAILLRYRKDKKEISSEQTEEVVEVDYHNKARGMLEKAKKLYEDKNEKEAYTMVSLAVRYYYKNRFELKKEMTRDLVIRMLKKQKKGHKKAEECLDMCDLVKFAKYKTNNHDFRKIVRLASDIIS